MKIMFCNDLNFGDIFNIYFVNKVLNQENVHVIDISKETKDTYYIFIGSIIHTLYLKNNTIVCGAGIGSRNEVFPEPHTVLLVRGPITRTRFLEHKYVCPERYGDPVLIMPLYYSPCVLKKYDVGFIPHKIDTLDFIKSIPDNLPYSWTVIDLTCDENGIEHIIDTILSCNKTVSSSLHGLIASHAYNVPTMWIDTINQLCGDGIKYIDYYHSLEIYTNKSVKLNFDSVLSDIMNYPQPSKDILDKRISDINYMINKVLETLNEKNTI